ncbi:hypothetical protein Daud_1992 [Candidatus Desulforudis audaxviator MP104C]|uniref:Uncharacterized protein n=1 Tax=Desulforudis audaxviator (strain MP104C) TaxID=477974 RepID=B1I634_DESAP|nr:hypothetical protein Daud_1992 [Candidatus Desulforudis audaxviator MP104C]
MLCYNNNSIMFARLKTLKNKDGSVRQYLQIVEYCREDGKTKQKVLCTLGRMEELTTLENLALELTQSQGAPILPHCAPTSRPGADDHGGSM